MISKTSCTYGNLLRLSTKWIMIYKAYNLKLAEIIRGKL
jgi:hypothetical protein